MPCSHLPRELLTKTDKWLKRLPKNSRCCQLLRQFWQDSTILKSSVVSILEAAGGVSWRGWTRRDLLTPQECVAKHGREQQPSQHGSRQRSSCECQAAGGRAVASLRHRLSRRSSAAHQYRHAFLNMIHHDTEMGAEV